MTASEGTLAGQRDSYATMAGWPTFALFAKVGYEMASHEMAKRHIHFFPKMLTRIKGYLYLSDLQLHKPLFNREVGHRGDINLMSAQ